LRSSIRDPCTQPAYTATSASMCGWGS
jgi:hypothetical protein